MILDPILISYWQNELSNYNKSEKNPNSTSITPKYSRLSINSSIKNMQHMQSNVKLDWINDNESDVKS